MSIILFIIIIAVLVFVHELGHFLVAKKSGIRVDEFAVGFPPKIFSWIRGETKYSINLIPFGGFVKIFGENPDEESMAGPDKTRSFVNKPKHIQAAVLVAGILFNIIFAWVLFSASYVIGVASVASDEQNTKELPLPLVVTEVLKSSPAEISGLKNGDTIKKITIGVDTRGAFINGKTLEIKKPINPERVRDFVQASGGKELQVTILRNKDEKVLTMSPQKGLTGDSYAVGIQLALISINKLPIHKAIWKGGETTINVIKETAVGLYELLSRILTRKADLTQVAGPVGIVSLVGQASQFGFGYLLSFTALISVNLAIINLVPFPALDGGRLLFVAIEAATRRKIAPKVANFLNIIGFALLILFMITVTISDIGRLFGK